MAYAVIMRSDDNVLSILSVVHSLKEADSVISWQVRCGSPATKFIVAKPLPERGVFSSIETGLHLRPVRCFLTEKAFEEILDKIWS